MTDLKKLREICDKADGLDTDVEYNLYMGDVPGDIVDRLAPFFLTFNPALVSNLLDEIERLRAERVRLLDVV